MQKLTLIVCLFLNGLNLSAQLGIPKGRSEGGLRQLDEYVLCDWVRKGSTLNDNVEGLPLLLDSWVKGDLQTLKDEHFNGVLLKLDLYQGQLMHLNNFTGDSSLINSDMLWQFSLPDSDTIYTFKRYQAPLAKNTTPIDNFFIVLLEGKNSLLVQPRIGLQKASRSSIVNSTGKLKDRFVLQRDYYLANSDNILIRIKNHKKSRLAAFGMHLKALDEFVAAHNLKWTDQADLALIIEFYNTLTTD